jgi:co-chaperonin GroES (HSP10)
MKKIQPIKDFVVMTIPETKSAIALPEGVQVNKEAYMVAIAVGPDCKSIVVGDRVIALKGTIVGIPLDGKQFYMAKEEMLMGVIVEDKE